MTVEERFSLSGIRYKKLSDFGSGAGNSQRRLPTATMVATRTHHGCGAILPLRGSEHAVGAWIIKRQSRGLLTQAAKQQTLEACLY